jgi:hypothetical protein
VVGNPLKNIGECMMRTAPVYAAAVAAFCAVPAFGSDVKVTVVPHRTVYLYSSADLAQLRAANPDHYARAQRILASANHLCRPGHEQLEFTQADARDVACQASLLRTSNPPQSQVVFTLDDTRYVALVRLTDDPPRLTPAREPLSTVAGAK